MIHTFETSQVQLKDSYWKNAFEKELDYLTSFECDRLLSHFRKTKKILPKATTYSGWEDTEIRGHTLGHYLSALAQAYASTKDRDIYERVQYIILELAQCQFENGYLSAFPEEFFDRVEQDKPVWVPWYTMHKIIAGLNDVYRLTQIAEALSVVTKLGDWVYERTSRWTPSLQKKVLKVEYGGMNDCMYELYHLTHDEKYITAAHQFDELDLFQAIYEGNDILENRHANTTIPKFLGALNRYLCLGDKEKFYLTTCENFWEMVVHSHSYVTGGNSEWEHFGKPNVLNAERTQANCETCNTYNMLKLTRGLFQITGNKKYANFYELTLINAILSSQNPETGMTTYFQPMATGYFKVYSKPFEHFWCCTGTGMENFTKLNDSLYFYEEDNLFINLYVSSTLNWADKNFTLSQDTQVPNFNTASFQVGVTSPTQLTLCFRIPLWANSLTICVNDERIDFADTNGYAHIKRLWREGDKIELTFGIDVKISSLADEPNAVAFTYGPLVLSAGLGVHDLEESTTGIMVRIPHRIEGCKDYIVITNDSVDTWKENISKNLIKEDGKLVFHLKGTDEDNHLFFTPHYRQHKEPYGIYWQLVASHSKELEEYLKIKKRNDLVRENEIDSVQPGNDQYELSHHILGELTESNDHDGYHYRYAKANGWFEISDGII